MAFYLKSGGEELQPFVKVIHFPILSILFLAGVGVLNEWFMTKETNKVSMASVAWGAWFDEEDSRQEINMLCMEINSGLNA